MHRMDFFVCAVVTASLSGGEFEFALKIKTGWKKKFVSLFVTSFFFISLSDADTLSCHQLFHVCYDDC